MAGVDDIHQTYGTSIESIRGKRRSLSDEAYRVSLARAYVRARDQANKLRAADVQAVDKQRADHRRAWTEPPTNGWDVIARRDATRFAGEIINGAQLVQEYETAERNRDTEMMRALAMRASELGSLLGGTGSREVIERYAATDPSLKEGLDGMRTSQSGDPAALLRHASQFAVTPPTELAGLQEQQIEQLARTELDG